MAAQRLRLEPTYKEGTCVGSRSKGKRSFLKGDRATREENESRTPQVQGIAEERSAGPLAAGLGSEKKRARKIGRRRFCSSWLLFSKANLSGGDYRSEYYIDSPKLLIIKSRNLGNSSRQSQKERQN